MRIIIQAEEYLRNRLGGLQPQVGIVLGSGLGKLADRIEAPLTIPYTDVPGFVKSTAIGHKGNFIIGTLGGKTVMAMQGRFHYYEGYPMDKVTLPVRVMVRLGIKALFVSNAAGGVNFDFHVGDLMIIRDHINKLPNPLIGPNLDEFGPRFPDMTRPYDPRLIALAGEIGREKGIELKKGVYLAGTGPSYETPSEYKYFRLIGADAIGMSTLREQRGRRGTRSGCRRRPYDRDIHRAYIEALTGRRTRPCSWTIFSHTTVWTSRPRVTGW